MSNVSPGLSLVAIFVVANIVPEDTAIPNALDTVHRRGTVLIVSGLYISMSKKWRVSFVTWIAGTLMLVMAAYNVFNKPDLDLSFVVIMLLLRLLLRWAYFHERNLDILQ